MDLTALEAKAIAFLKSNASDNTAVSFSGGKDSLVALDLATRVGIQKAVFCDTTIEFNETYDYIQRISNFYDIDIIIVRAPTDFFSMIEQVTIPSRRQRWCCEVFKFGPLGKWAIENNVNAYITGLRRSESVARRNYTEIDKNPLVPAVQLNPLIEWKADQVWEYIHKYNLPVNDLYDYFKRIGCWCCPFNTNEEWERIKQFAPDKHQKLVNVLKGVAEREGIRNEKEFIDKYAWTYWIHPTRKVSTTVTRICSGGQNLHVVIENRDSQQTEKMVMLLPVMTDDFFALENKLRISIDPRKVIKLRILLEKALNCVGCGACISYCLNSALYLNNGQIAVDQSKCDKCGRCLNASTIKGGCISRHYSPKRTSLIEGLEEMAEQ